MQEIALREALEERYLAYALSTIMHRALPDARDGLKPVHRRILYGMRLLRLDPGAAFKKSAKIVGDVMGNFHPHGDQAIYDALVRLAQDFASRYPLVDGQGNFGNVDGDNRRRLPLYRSAADRGGAASARRHRRRRGRFPPELRRLVARAGRAAGGVPQPAWRTARKALRSAWRRRSRRTISPNCATRRCTSSRQPNARSRTLLKYVPGPDFPTGGLIVDPPEAIAEAYTTGRGSFRLRARWKTEDTGRGTYQIVVTEIPWQVQKMRLVERIAELINEKKLPLVADMRDESAEDVRLVFEPRSRSVDPALMMESLFKLTELESRIPLNMNVLVRGRIPKVVGLAEALNEWLAHRRDVLLRRSRYRLSQIEHRLEVLGGYLVAYLNLDKVIKIIRKEDEPKPVLMQARSSSPTCRPTPSSTCGCATCAGSRRWRSARRTKTSAPRRNRSRICCARRRRSGRRSPARSARCATNSARRRRSASAAPALPKRRRMTRPRSKRLWSSASRSPSWCPRRAGSARCAARSPTFPVSRSRPTTGSSSRSSPRRRRSFWCSPPTAAATPSRRRSCRAGAATASRSGCSSSSSRRPTSFRCSATRADASSSSASKQGRGFVVPEDECLANTRKGKQVLNVAPPDEARAIAPAEGELVAAIGENRKMVVFPLDQVPEMTRGRGVRLQRHKDGGLSDVKTFEAEKGLTWTDTAGRVFTLSLKELADWRGNRGDAGRLAPKGFPKTNKFDGGAKA